MVRAEQAGAPATAATVDEPASATSGAAARGAEALGEQHAFSQRAVVARRHVAGCGGGRGVHGSCRGAHQGADGGHQGGGFHGRQQYGGGCWYRSDGGGLRLRPTPQHYCSTGARGLTLKERWATHTAKARGEERTPPLKAFTEGGAQAVFTRTRMSCAVDSSTQAQHSRAAHSRPCHKYRFQLRVRYIQFVDFEYECWPPISLRVSIRNIP